MTPGSFSIPSKTFSKFLKILTYNTYRYIIIFHRLRLEKKHLDRVGVTLSRTFTHINKLLCGVVNV